MTPDQGTDPTSVDNDTYDRLAHPCYARRDQIGLPMVLVGDEVALRDDDARAPVGIVTAIYADAVEVSTGDDYKVADLVLLRRAQ